MHCGPRQTVAHLLTHGCWLAQVTDVVEAGADWVHVDVMVSSRALRSCSPGLGSADTCAGVQDGRFVPSEGLSGFLLCQLF